MACRPQGVLAGVVEEVRPLALPHLVAEHQRVGAAAVVVAGDTPRVEQQLKRPRRQDRGVEPDMYVDFVSRPVRAVRGGGGDVDHRRRRQPDQLDAVAAVVVYTPADNGVLVASKVERCDASGIPGSGEAGQPHSRPQLSSYQIKKVQRGGGARPQPL